ncbi:MAG: 5'-deoxynucleotidase YfbR [Candidatus Celerinatantimonas neptuna]|nr:MAG: 5'-deoxynucleotidase YfbR [Candidatus Celerinatantimonas neptuna]
MSNQSSHSHFLAQLARMKLIHRWPLMHNQQLENIAEHSLMVAMMAHLLAVIENRLFDGDIDTGHVVLLALYHDSSEVFTGDLPNPVKYANTELRDAYKALEVEAEHRLLTLLPEPLQADFTDLLISHHHLAHQQQIVKDADILSAYIKCIEELKSGNQEFINAKRKLEQTLKERSRPPLDYMMDTFISSMGLSLDELSQFN